MKKYFIFGLICFSTFSYSSDKGSAKLGQVESGMSPNDCNAPQIAGCGPCFKLCVEQNKSDRGAKETGSSTATKSRSSSSSASKQ